MTQKLTELDCFELQRLMDSSTDTVAYVCRIKPPLVGITSFLTFLECRHFSPLDKKVRDLYSLYLIPWQAAVYALAVIPASYSGAANELMAKLGLTTYHGSPTISDEDDIVRSFPINSPNVHTIENVPGHFVYAADNIAIHTALAAEKKAVEQEWINLTKNKSVIIQIPDAAQN